MRGLALSLLLAGGAPAWADEPPAWRTDFTYASAYVFRGVERAGNSAQGAVEYNQEGFRGGVWASQPFTSGEPGEISLTAAYTWQPAEAVTLEASAGQSWYSDVAGLDHALEVGLAVTLAPVKGFSPSVGCYHDFRLRADTLQVGVTRSIPLTKLGAFLDLNLFAGWANGDDWRPDAPGPDRHDSYRYWGAEAHLPYRVGAHTTVVTGVHYADNHGRSATNGPFGRSSGQNFWVTVGVNLDF